MNTTNFTELKNNLDLANKALKKAVAKTLRKGGVPSMFKAEYDASRAAYKAYWSAVDKLKATS